MIGRSVGRFKIISEIGSGGMATVWKAEDPLLVRPVALKILAPELARQPKARRRFLHEARTAARLDHPGIVAIHDSGTHGDLVYIALAFIDGQTLSSAAGQSPMSSSEVARVGIAAAEALDFAHRQGVLHRDVTGRNIMVAHNSRVFVVDFGLALAVGNSRITSTGTTVGTVSYLSPEAAQSREMDARSDVYGLGVALYEAITGTLPFTGQMAGIIYSTINVDPEHPCRRRPDASPELARVILKAMAKDPAHRHQSMGEVAVDLASVADVAPLAVSRSDAMEVTEVLPLADGWEPPDHPCVAVFPFDYLAMEGESNDSSTMFARGFAELLSSSLAAEPGIRVIPPSVSGGATDGSRDIGALARRLCANLMLTGSVQRVGNRIRVSYSLVDPYRRVQAAGGRLDGDAHELFSLEDGVVAAVLGMLGRDAEERRTASRIALDPVAEERYVQALGYLQHTENEALVDGAIGILGRLEKGAAPTAPVLAALGRAYLLKYRLTAHRQWEAKAASCCDRALRLDPRSAEVLITLGEIHVAAGRHEEALHDFEQALQHRPDAPEALIGMSRALEAAGRAPEAEDTLRRWIELQPDDARAHAQLGLVLFNGGRYSEAAASWLQVSRLAPDSPRSHFNIACAYFHLDRFEEAVEECLRSIQLRPTLPAYSTLGTVLFYLGRTDEAISALEKAAHLRPDDPMGWGNLGSACRWTEGRSDQAAQWLEQAISMMRGRLERNQNSAMDWAWLGCWLANRDRCDEAVESIERALELEPHNVRCQALAGMIHFHRGDRVQALRWIAEAVKNGYGRAQLITEPSLTRLRQDPEFLEIVNGSKSSDESPP